MALELLRRGTRLKNLMRVDVLARAGMSATRLIDTPEGRPPAEHGVSRTSRRAGRSSPWEERAGVSLLRRSGWRNTLERSKPQESNRARPPANPR